MTCEGLGGQLGDATLGRWWQAKRWCEQATGLDLGPDCLNQTTGGGHAPTSKHYIGEAFDASHNFEALARFLVPFATGPERWIDELFCSDIGIAYSSGAVSSFRDACCHTHVGLRAGAPLPSLTKPEDEENAMGVYGGGSIRPGEGIPFRIVPPGCTTCNGGYADPVYITIPFDTLGGQAGQVRWAVTDKQGKVIASNDVDAPGAPRWRVPNSGVEIVAHPGAYQLTVENKEPVGGRIVGPPVFEWARPKVAGFAVTVSEPATIEGGGVSHAEPGFAVADIEGEPQMAKADAEPGTDGSD